MKLIHSDFKRGEVKLKTENLDDLWYLSNIIDKGDLVKGKTIRKISLGNADERAQKATKKSIFLEINVEKITFHKYSNDLRVSGTINECPEDIAKGSYHTFDIDDNTIITLIKKKWLKFQQDKLNESAQEKVANILICVLDREEAYFALLKKQGYTLLSHIKGKVQKKNQPDEVKTNFYEEISNILKEYIAKYSAEHIIVASPSFWKEDLLKNVKDDEIKKKMIMATCSSVDKTAINEVLKRPELKEALKKDRTSKELKLVEELLDEISKNGAAVYGVKEVNNTANLGAIRQLLITDSFITKKREEEKYDEIEKLLNLVESMKGTITIISSDNEAGSKLDGLGGIAALLRYKLSY